MSFLVVENSSQSLTLFRPTRNSYLIVLDNWNGRG